MTPRSHPDLVVGLDDGDDAMVWRRPHGPALVATTDFFTPIVDDPRVWGRIAAVNAASDVYAMGGRPLFALNLAVWPRDVLPLAVLSEVLAGGGEAAAAGGWVVGGGHTVDGPEPMYGQAVIGEADAHRLLTNAAATPGHRLVLTKPLGTGILATAVKRLDPAAVALGGRIHDLYERAVTEMTRLNDQAASVAASAEAPAATDVTGFGFLGHLHRMLLASGVAAEIAVDRVPVLDGVRDLAAEGYVPGGTRRNLEYVAPVLVGRDDRAIDDVEVTVLADAQTSGGLLFACPPGSAGDAVRSLRASGHDAAVVGEVVPADGGGAGAIRLGRGG